MIKPYTTIKKCRSCNKEIFKKDFIFSIGKMAITGIFLKKKKNLNTKFHLTCICVEIVN